MLDRKVVFLAKADYFTKPGAKGKLTALFFKLADQLPIDRSGGRAGDAALRTGMRVLSRGDLLGIYPEGTRSPDGRLYRGKTGVARMALEGLVPVLPVAMVGTDKAQPIGRRIPKIVPITIKIGEPLDFSRYEGMEGDRFILRSITDEIMYRLMELSGQEYVDVYAATMKERLAAARKGKAPEPTALSGQAPGQRPVASGRSAAAAADQPRDEPADSEDARRRGSPVARAGRELTQPISMCCRSGALHRPPQEKPSRVKARTAGLLGAGEGAGAGAAVQEVRRGVDRAAGVDVRVLEVVDVDGPAVRVVRPDPAGLLAADVAAVEGRGVVRGHRGVVVRARTLRVVPPGRVHRPHLADPEVLAVQRGEGGRGPRWRCSRRPRAGRGAGCRRSPSS